MSRDIGGDQPHLDELSQWRVQRLLGDAQGRKQSGGLFFWLQLRKPVDTRGLLTPAIERGVAFMPGEFFFPGRPQAAGALRLNFSHATASQADRGLSILADLIGRSMR